MPLPIIGAVGTAIGAFSLAGVGVLLRSIVLWLIGKFAQYFIAKVAILLASFTFIIGAWLAFTAVAYGAIAGLEAIAPEGFRFGFLLIPDGLPAMYTAYLGVTVAKRLFDWIVLIQRDSVQARNSMNY